MGRTLNKMCLYDIVQCRYMIQTTIGGRKNGFGVQKHSRIPTPEFLNGINRNRVIIA